MKVFALWIIFLLKIEVAQGKMMNCWLALQSCIGTVEKTYNYVTYNIYIYINKLRMYIIAFDKHMYTQSFLYIYIMIVYSCF